MVITELLHENPLVLAPMAGITDLPFRILCRELGAGLVFSEMVSAEALVRNHAKTFALLQSDPAERPVAFQIFGSRPDAMAKAARILSDRPVDIIDINMGCPVPKVLKSGSGSALLKDMGLAREIMGAVAESSAVPVTVKIRLGWDAKSIVALDLARAAESAGVAAVSVHARTRAQAFSGSADWSMIRTVKEHVGIPVIGNGDVRSERDAKSMKDETGCDGIMIGRACQGNPWIFREAKQFLETAEVIPPPTLTEKRELIKRHVQEMVNLVGEDKGVREMRKHLCWYSRGMPGGAEFRARINHLAKIEDIVREVTGYFIAASPRNDERDASRATVTSAKE